MKEILLIFCVKVTCLKKRSADDKSGLANGVLKYSFHLNAGENTEFFVVVPFYGWKIN